MQFENCVLHTTSPKNIIFEDGNMINLLCSKCFEEQDN